MVTVKEGRYLKIGYFQKSRILFGLIAGETYTATDKKLLLTTYLFADSLDESIIEYFLYAEFEAGVELDSKITQYLYASYKTEEGTELYIFDLTQFKDDVEKFIDGQYSEFSKNAKRDILKFNKYPIGDDGKLTRKLDDIKGNLFFYTIFNPIECREKIAEELYEINDICSSKEEAYKILKEMREICEPFNKDRETFKNKLI